MVAPTDVLESGFKISATGEVLWEADLLSRRVTISGAESLMHESGCYDIDDISELITSIIHPEDKERAYARVIESLTNKETAVVEDVFRIYHKDHNDYLWVHNKFHLHRNASGEAFNLKGRLVLISNLNSIWCKFLKHQQQYDFLINNVGLIVFTLNKNGNFSSLTRTWELLGYTVENTIGHSFIEYLSDEHVQLFWKEFGGLLSGSKVSIDEQFQLIGKEGEKIWVRIRAKSTFNCNNIVESIFGTIENINNRYNDELLLQERNEKINTILNNSKEIIVTIDLDTKIISNVNQAVEVLGYSQDEWIGKCYKSLDDVPRQKFHELMKLSLKSELKVNNQVIYFPDKFNRESIPFEFSTSIFSLKNSKYLLCVLRDIRDRLEYEKKFFSISAQLEHLLNNIDDVYAIFDLKTDKYDFVSNNVESLFACDKQFYCENNLWRESIYKEDLVEVEKEVEQIILNKTRGEIFYRIKTLTGETKMILEKLVVGTDSEGNAEKLYIVKKDYTNIEIAEQSLLESERKFRFISENISDFISIHASNGKYTYASPSIKNILGFSPVEIVGSHSFDLIHPEDFAKVLNDAIQLIIVEKKETQFRCRMQSKNGTYKWVETYAKPVIDANGSVSSIISSSRDVTDQVNAESKLKESEERYRLLSENSNDVIGVHNLNKEFIYVSPSAKQLLGYEPAELIGKKPSDILLKGGESGSKAEDVLREKKGYKYLTKVVTKAGEEKLLEVWLEPVFKDGEVVALQSSSRDVTEREKLLHSLEQSLTKERELNELREKFVSTASHQFRTPLTVIQSGVEIMDLYVEDLPKDKQAKFQKQFKRIQEEVSRLEYLMKDMLVLGRANASRTPYHPIKGSLVDFCNTIIEDKYNNRFSSDRHVLVRVEGLEVPVSFDPTLLAHSLENIISNAFKYSSGGNIPMDIIFKSDKVAINISDNGIGIPEKDIKNLFQPFYRATNTIEFEGTGLGLSIVKEFIESHGGEIFLTSELNKGTTVSVILPIE